MEEFERRRRRKKEEEEGGGNGSCSGANGKFNENMWAF